MFWIILWILFPWIIKMLPLGRFFYHDFRNCQLIFFVDSFRCLLLGLHRGYLKISYWFDLGFDFVSYTCCSFIPATLSFGLVLLSTIWTFWVLHFLGNLGDILPVPSQNLFSVSCLGKNWHLCLFSLFEHWVWKFILLYLKNPFYNSIDLLDSLQMLSPILCRYFQMMYTSAISLMLQSLSGLLSCKFLSRFNHRLSLIYIHWLLILICKLRCK